MSVPEADGRSSRQSHRTGPRLPALARRLQRNMVPGQVVRPIFNATQGCPILFSRPLALRLAGAGPGADRPRGLARRADLMPWTAVGRTPHGDLTVSRASVEAVCRAPDHPVAIVAPGRHRDAAPRRLAGRPVASACAPVQYLSGDAAGLHWRKVESYTVIRCSPFDTPPAAGVMRSLRLASTTGCRCATTGPGGYLS